MGPLLIAQLVKNPPAVQETPVQFWVGKTPEEGDGYPLQYSGLEKAMVCTWREEMVTHSSVLAWKSHGQSTLAAYSPQGSRGGYD